MTLDYNPGATKKKCVENLDVGIAHAVINSPTYAAELQWKALRTGALDVVELFAGTGASAPPLDDAHYNAANRPIIVDLIARGSEASSPVIFNDFTVTAVTGDGRIYNENLTQPPTPSRLNTSNDGLFLTTNVLGAKFDAQFGTGAYGLDRHVLAVEVWVAINLTTRVTRKDVGGLITWSHDIPAYASHFGTLNVRMGETIIESPISTTWTHWTPQKIRDFASGGSRAITITCRAGPGYWRIDRLFLRVYSIAERRRGVGIGSPTAAGWIPFSLTTPNATGSPAITAGEEMTLIARRINDYSVDSVAAATLPWRYIRGTMPNGQWRRHPQPWNPSTTGAGPPGAQIDGILAARFSASGTVIADSQPYRAARGARVHGTVTASQTLTVAGDSTVYGRAFVLAGWIPTNGRPEGNLRAEVFAVSGGTRVFSPVEITPDDVDRLPVASPVSNVDEEGAVYKLGQFRFPESTTLAAGQYEVRLSAPGAASGRPWHAAFFLAEAHTTDQTFGGNTDKGTGIWPFAGTDRQLSDASWTSDLLLTLADVPAAVTGVGTSVGSLTAHHAEVCDPNVLCDGCADDTMPFATLSWTPAPSGTPDISGYQVDRMDDLDPEWRRVATVAGRTTARWDDQEVSIGVSSSYRIRVLRSDGVVGEWSTPTSIRIPPGQIALAFSSNFAPGLGCVFPEIWDGNEAVRAWEFQEAGDVVLGRIYGRDRHVAFRPLERAGDAWGRTLLMSAMCSIVRPSLAIFDPLRDLAWAPIPYVCIRDGEGNRFYASVAVTGGTNRRNAPGTEIWTSEITVVEVADRPAVVDTSVPPVEGPIDL